MKLMKRVGTVAFITLLGVSAPVLAEQPGPDMMKQDHEAGGTQPRRIRGKARMEMYQKLQEMQDHSKIMEGITDQQRLMGEMKKHMRMADSMTERIMMLLHHGIPGPQQEPGYQEHHSDMEQKLMQDYRSITRSQKESESQKRDSSKSQQIEPQASPKDLKQPEHQESHPDKSQ